MTAVPDMNLPAGIDREALLAGLDRVLDPELDESVLSLGFVESVEGNDAGEVTVCLRLPTYWCAANFSYLMASDVQRELAGLQGVSSVNVRLGEHFAGREVEDGSGASKTFAEAFPEGGPDTLEETRRIFVVKGFISRQERLLRALKDSGLMFPEISKLRVVDAWELGVEERMMSRYMDRRKEMGIDCSDLSPLIVDIKGDRVPAEELEAHYVRARTTRLAMEASGSLCSAMLQSRNENWLTPTP